MCMREDMMICDIKRCNRKEKTKEKENCSDIGSGPEHDEQYA